MKKRLFILTAFLGIALLQATACTRPAQPETQKPPETVKETQPSEEASAASELPPPQTESASEKAPAQTESLPSAGDYIEADEAKKIALEHAGVQESDISYPSVSLDVDHNSAEYDVEFYVENKEYDYNIDAVTGVIRGYDYDIEQDRSVQNQSQSSEGVSITEEEAKSIALEQVPGAADSDLRIKTDRDDGRLVYEGDILYNGIEYEFEIDAATGSLIKWEADH